MADTARLVYDKLLSLGVQPQTAAGAVGSLMGESGRGLNTGAVNPRDGRDGSDSIGMGQWNSNRATNLRNTAAGMGLDWRDPRAQVEHIGNELQGSHKHVLNALLGAGDDIGRGVDVWTRQYEVPANAGAQVAARMPHAQAFASALASGGSMPSSTGSRGTQTEGDASTPMGRALAQGGEQNPMQRAIVDAAGGDKTVMGSVLSGGPGALFGNPQRGWNLGDTLSMVGAAMMARDNPQGANALFNGLTDYNKIAAAAGKSADSGLKTSIDEKTGQAVTYDNKGNVIARPIPGWQKPEKDPATFKTGDQKLFDDYQDKAGKHYSVADQANMWRDKVLKGELDLNAFSRVGAGWRALTNSTNAADQAVVGFNQFLEQARNETLMAAKGTQTEGDAKRAMDTLLPSTGKYDNATALGALDRLVSTNRLGFDNMTRSGDMLLKRFKGEDGASHAERWNQQRSGLDEFERGYGSRRDSWLSQRGTPTQAGSTAPAGTAAPVASPAAGNVVTVRTPDEARRLPPGTPFRTPDGKEYTR